MIVSVFYNHQASMQKNHFLDLTSHYSVAVLIYDRKRIRILTVQHNLNTQE